MKLKLKSLQEAFMDLRPEEQQTLKFVKDPSVKSGIANLISSMRQRGKNISLSDAAKQLAQFASQKGMEISPELQRLSSAPEVPAPPEHILKSQPGMVQKPPSKLQKRLAPSMPKGDVPTFLTKKGGTAPIPPQMTKHFKSLNQTADEINKRESEPEQEDWQKRAQKMKQTKVEPWHEEAPPRKSFDPHVFEKTVKMKPKLGESKKMIKKTLTETQKRFAQQIIVEQLREQLKLKKDITSLFEESPMSNVWDSIKGAGSVVPNKNSSGALTQGSGGRNELDQKKKEIVGGISKAISKANQMRQKFNGEILKNAEIMNQYHNAVLRVYELYQRFSGVLGPAGLQAERQVEDLVVNLKNDLKSEKEQIDALIGAFSKSGAGTK